MISKKFLLTSISWISELPLSVIVAESSFVVSEQLCCVVISSSRLNLFSSDCMTWKGYLTTLFLETKCESFTTSGLPPMKNKRKQLSYLHWHCEYEYCYIWIKTYLPALEL